MPTPPDAALSRLGQIQGAGDAKASFLRLGALEVLDAFERTTVFKGKTRQRNIKGGSSKKFPITGKMAARYHTPGVPILGEGNSPSDLNERIIELDALMIADVAVQELDELMNYYDVRAIYTKELGRALAYEYDRRAARMIYAAAKNVTEPLALAQNTGRIGHTIELLPAYEDATTSEAKGNALVQAIFDSVAALIKKDVPLDGMCGVFTPDDYFHITQSSKAINVDFNGGTSNGSIAEGKVMKVCGIPIYMSNHVTQPNYTNVTGDTNAAYAQDLSNCKGLIFHQEAIGILTLLQPGLQVTSGDWNISHQATLMVARQAIGMGILRTEAAVVIEDNVNN